MSFFCEKCNYKTTRKDCYNGHLKSKRHLKIEEYKYECEFCLKKYIHSAGLSRHKKNCKKKKEKEKNILRDLELEKIKEEMKSQREEIGALKGMTEQMDKLTKATLLFCEKLAEKDETIKELTKNAGNNNNNNTVNIQVFLDEKCKNAMPIMDFIRDLQFKLTDINPERPASTIESLSKCITDKLEDMDETERPVHCTDEKRLVFHVKDASGWTKDINNKKIDKAIGWANMRHQGAFHDKAAADNWTSQKNDTKYLNMNVAMGKFSDNPAKAKKKIKRAIAKHAPLPKNWSLQKSSAV
jgi:hypothetical protein